MPKPPPPKKPTPPTPAIQIETDDLPKASPVTKPAIPVAMPVENKSTPAAVKVAEAVPYRPTLRPVVCLLTVLDDGKSDGEVIRIRGNRFVIGRTEGELRLPHDEQISSRHVEITRQVVAGVQRWVVTDLQSTNGVFLRISRSVLSDRAEFLVGKGRYRFEEAGKGLPQTVDHLASMPIPSGTVGHGDNSPRIAQAALVELVASGIGNRLVLAKPEYWIGTDSSCAICRSGDVFTSPKHVHLFCDSKGAWNAKNNKAPNGLWARIPQITVEGGCLLQIGEQRLRLQVDE